MSPYEDGATQQYDEKGRIASRRNPHPQGTAEHAEWERGYRHAGLPAWRRVWLGDSQMTQRFASAAIGSHVGDVQHAAQ